MAYGLVNAPAFFQAFINDVFHDMLNCFVIVHLDDILIYSKSYPNHVHHVRLVLSHLLAHRLYVKVEKYKFYKNEHFLVIILVRAGSTWRRAKSLP